MINKNNPVLEFNAQDRCDRCRAQAYALAQRDGLELTFCLHHATQHNVALEMDGWEIIYDLIGVERLLPNSGVLVN